MENIIQCNDIPPEIWVLIIKSLKISDIASLRKTCTYFNDLIKENLRHLDLSRCNITDEGLEHIKTLKNLTYLNLTRCEKITDEGLRHISFVKNIYR